MYIHIREAVTVDEFYSRIGAEVYGADRRPPRNADALADLLKEFNVEAVHIDHRKGTLASWLPVLQAFRDLKISLQASP